MNKVSIHIIMISNENKRVFNVLTKVQKCGSNLFVRIPQSIAEESGIVDGSEVELMIEDKGISLRLTPLKKELNLEKLLARITDENRHQEVDFGKPEGYESV
ncbi:AbrB/MazE/SpoVT family DNA-binding domain-containing protein [Virgibacillus flavescens]|uniref:AbrB/MazE/SpoVT family DNA-binding domain-containing protein n=1 Tax=Virgibacillus flavescens TaxID=1611422 RepID=UPI003D3468F1